MEITFLLNYPLEQTLNVYSKKTLDLEKLPLCLNFRFVFNTLRSKFKIIKIKNVFFKI